MISNKYKKPIFITITFILLAFVMSSFFVYHFLHKQIIKSGQKVHYIFSSGTTIRNLAWQLYKEGDLSHPKLLVWYTKFSGLGKQLKAGEYEFEGPKNIKQILQQLRDGKVVIHHITFIEGHTLKQAIKKLEASPYLIHTISKLSQTQLKNQLHIQKAHLEGLFFPDTYQYTYGMTDLSILKRARKRMQLILNNLWQHRAKNLPYKTAYQALIVASLIEKEAALQTEQELIAGVIINRLHKNMYLQIDPTVIYAMGDRYHGKITAAALKLKNPYNTYRFKGLPPSPICLPGKEAIYAALHPKKTDFLYFVAKGDGSHAFAKTLAQQDANIRKYLLNKQ